MYILYSIKYEGPNYTHLLYLEANYPINIFSLMKIFGFQIIFHWNITMKSQAYKHLQMKRNYIQG